MFGWGESKALVGLDIGSTSVKAIELARQGDHYEVVNLAVEEFAAGAADDGLAVSTAIGKIFAENNIKTANVATAVSGRSVIVKKIVVTGETPEQLTAAIAAEAESTLQINLSEVNWDYQVIGTAPGRSAFEVMLVAVKREKIASHTDLVHEAGKNSVVVDIDAFALENAFEMSYQPAPDLIVGLIDIGGSITKINIVRNGVPLYTRDVSAGDGQVTEFLEKELGLSAGDAQKIKRGVDLPNVSAEARTAHLHSALDSLTHEIHKTFDFFRDTCSAGGIQRIYVAGGLASAPGLVEILQEELHIPVEVMDPFLRTPFRSPKLSPEQIREIAPRMGVAVGLALRSFD